MTAPICSVSVPLPAPFSSMTGSDDAVVPRRSRRTIPAVLTGALMLGSLAACGGEARADGQEPASERMVTRVINVETLTLDRRPFTEVVRITGTVQANRDVTVSAEEAGPIREILVDRGATVETGQALARIDDALLQSQVDEARARADLARETWDRRRRLFEDDGVGNELVYLEARYGAEQAAAALRTLEERLSRTVIRAPFDGLVEAREVEVGTMVASGTLAFRVVEVDPIKVAGGVPERFAADIERGTAVRVTFDPLRGDVYEGQLTFSGATVNPRNRTFPVETVIRNPGQRVKPEMVANMELVRRELDHAMVVPQDALIRVEEGFVAFVAVDREGETLAERRHLRLGGGQRNQVVVEEGLEPGDRLIVVGQQQVAHGDRVRVVASTESNGG
ncbi:MAG: efflux RND transporter periplasmic adaptor subunit [Gemmatimonadales bacterium]|nr:MAG: efflux RND transporter periplasmic adaptor subunit [Gemmatimonadales bacterium]